MVLNELLKRLEKGLDANQRIKLGTVVYADGYVMAVLRERGIGMVAMVAGSLIGLTGGDDTLQEGIDTIHEVMRQAHEGNYAVKLTDEVIEGVRSIGVYQSKLKVAV